MSRSFKPTYLFLVSILFLTACANTTSLTQLPVTSDESAVTQTFATTEITPTPVMQEVIWEELLKITPFPHQFPLPEAVQSPLDGTYAKVDASPPQYWTCY